MNIFYLDKDPYKAAEFQYNKHVVKMILESAQMLCTAHHHYDPFGDTYIEIPYKKAHYNHPSTIWCRQNKNHYRWLYNHMIALGQEYTARYGKEHLSITKCRLPLFQYPVGMPDGKFKQPPQCMPDEYKHESAIHAYWNYYIGDKASICNTKKEKLYTKIPNIAL